MKKMKKLAALFLAVVMVMAMGLTAMAQTIGTAADEKANITIKNASKGETYTVYKLFNATVSEDKVSGNSVSIAYTLMSGKADAGPYFVADKNGYVKKADTTNEDTLKTEAFQNWARTYGEKVVDEVEADGSELVFQGLDYGYYFVDSSQGANVTVDSTTPNATIYDKNSKEPTTSGNDLKTVSGTVSGNDVYIGSTVTYTVAFYTTNYIGAGENADKVTSYIIEDTLPNFLEDVTVTSIKIMDGENEQVSLNQNFVNGKIVIDWVNWVDTENEAGEMVKVAGDSLYNNGSEIVLTYTAKVADGAAIDGKGNKNNVTVKWTTVDNPEPGDSKDWLTDSETIYTYAIALKKVDDNGNALAGAEFSIADLAVKGTDGNYTVTTADDTTRVTGNLKCDSNGELVIKGVPSETTYSVTEVKAPEGYNKLTDPFDVKAVKTGKTITTTTKYLVNGNVVDEGTEAEKIEYTNTALSATAHFVVNKTGMELPSTGGIGTTIFYVVGGILVVGAGILLITKKRMSAK